MSLQSERIQLLMQRLSLTEMARDEALAEQAAQKGPAVLRFPGAGAGE